MKNLRELIHEKLLSIGAEGLCNPDLECGCSIDDLMPCGEPDLENCVAARRSFENNKSYSGEGYFMPFVVWGIDDED